MRTNKLPQPRTLSDEYYELNKKIEVWKAQIATTADNTLKEIFANCIRTAEKNQAMLLDLINEHGDLHHEEFFKRGAITPLVKLHPINA
jgi:streptomycin 6-kinase